MVPTLAAQPAYRERDRDLRPAIARVSTSVPPERSPQSVTAGNDGDRTQQVRALKTPRKNGALGPTPAAPIKRTGRTEMRGKNGASRDRPQRADSESQVDERHPRIPVAAAVGAGAIALGVLVLAAIGLDRARREPAIPPVAAAQDPPLAEAGFGEVRILTEPYATVSTEAGAIGEADERGSAGPFSLPAGKHEIRVSLSDVGFQRVRSLTVRQNQVHEIEIPARKGWLTVSVAPWAKVKIDGVEHGLTPLGSIPLNEGSHNVILENPDIKKRHQTLVRVEPGQTATLKVDLETVGERM
jgi:hypothetical protein